MFPAKVILFIGGTILSNFLVYIMAFKIHERGPILSLCHMYMHRFLYMLGAIRIRYLILLNFEGELGD